MVDACRGRRRVVHDHARQHGRERRAPSIQRDLGVGISELQWIVTGYALSAAALMLTGGKFADLLGRRRIFVVGIVVFTIASLFCGLADSGDELIAWRIVQGAAPP